MAGTFDKISGKTKQAGGKASGDKSMQIEGKLQELKGHATDAINDMKRRMDDNRKK